MENLVKISGWRSSCNRCIRGSRIGRDLWDYSESCGQVRRPLWYYIELHESLSLKWPDLETPLRRRIAEVWLVWPHYYLQPNLPTRWCIITHSSHNNGIPSAERYRAPLASCKILRPISNRILLVNHEGGNGSWRV